MLPNTTTKINPQPTTSTTSAKTTNTEVDFYLDENDGSFKSVTRPSVTATTTRPASSSVTLSTQPTNRSSFTTSIACYDFGNFDRDEDNGSIQRFTQPLVTATSTRPLTAVGDSTQ